MKIQALLIAGFLLIAPACSTTPSHPRVPAGDPTSTASCIGPDDPRGFMVYLHGRDFDPPGTLELQNRRVLEQIAENLHIKIALPRGSETCGGNGPPRCWGWEISDSQTEEALKAIQSAADSCFGPGKSFGLIGFSNGGYVVDRIFRTCALQSSSWFISVGAGAANPPSAQWASDLSGCGKFTLIEGTQDSQNYDKGGAYLSKIQLRGGHAHELQFEGGHEIPYEPTRTATFENLR
jgi:predicted esterase